MLKIGKYEIKIKIVVTKIIRARQSALYPSSYNNVGLNVLIEKAYLAGGSRLYIMYGRLLCILGWTSIFSRKVGDRTTV